MDDAMDVDTVPGTLNVPDTLPDTLEPADTLPDTITDTLADTLNPPDTLPDTVNDIVDRTADNGDKHDDDDGEKVNNDVDLDPDSNNDVVIVAENTAPNKSKSATGLPLARIRAVVNADDEVQMVSKAAVILITKATELFIGQLSSDAARHISGQKRKTIQLKDINAVASMCDEYAFLDGIALNESTTNRSKSAASEPSQSPTLDDQAISGKSSTVTTAEPQQAVAISGQEQ